MGEQVGLTNKNAVKVTLVELIKSYKSRRHEFLDAKYKEASLRNDFLNPFLKLLGWDVDNVAEKSQFLRDVVQEETIDVEEGDSVKNKNPDYTLRINGERKFFLEAKKPSIDVSKDQSASFQIRRYGWNASLNYSILSNFEYILIFDCRIRPAEDDTPTVGLIKTFHYTEYESKFEEIYQYLSFESVLEGRADEDFLEQTPETIPFDEYFLEQIEEWRKLLAESIVRQNKELCSESINFITQRILNRIIFLRICEDRNLEDYETLKNVDNYDDLKRVFIEADAKYNSGLFDFVEDSLSLNATLDSVPLCKIFKALYFPYSPFDFSVIDPYILSQIYERFLSKEITIDKDRNLLIDDNAEASASKGVVPTPSYICKYIVSKTLDTLIAEDGFEEVISSQSAIADICCGSGSFVLALYDYLVASYTDFYSKSHDHSYLFVSSSNGTKRLSLEAKRDILIDHIFGVDVNPYAVEVTRFSLQLKLLENETEASICEYMAKTKNKALPNLASNIKHGNSLVDSSAIQVFDDLYENDTLLNALCPFDWQKSFSHVFDRGGFSAILGNPPYVRIQNLVAFFSDEISFYRHKNSPFSYNTKDLVDKYYLFIERASELLQSEKGLLGYIVPNKFFTIKHGKKLRNFIASNFSVQHITNFGTTQVFPNKLTYTAFLILSKAEVESLTFRKVSNRNELGKLNKLPTLRYSQKQLSSTPWVFISPQASKVFDQVFNNKVAPLGEVAEITVGLQTSCDYIYIIKEGTLTDETIIFTKDDVEWEVEKSILKNAFYDAKIEPYRIAEPNAYMIFPYKVIDGNAHVIPPEEMSESYPLCWKYLKHYKTKLTSRSINGKDPKWYEFGRRQSLAKFANTEKLIWSVLSKGAPYTIDQTNALFTGGGNGPYYSLVLPKDSKYSLYFILAIVSHSVLEGLVHSCTSEFDGDYYSHGKQFLQRLPIPIIDFSSSSEKQKHDEIATLSSKLIEYKEDLLLENLPQKRKGKEMRVSGTRGKLDTLIRDLYNISEGDQLCIETNLFTTLVKNED